MKQEASSHNSRERSTRHRSRSRIPVLRKLFFLRRNDPWLVPALGLVLVLGLTGVGGILKLWTNTPEGVEPEVKVSLLDLLQARALIANAEKEQAAGNDAAALVLWRSAAGNTPGDPEILRNFLRLQQKGAATLVNVRETIRFGHWLLQLTDREVTDVELVASTLEAGRQYASALKLLDETGVTTDAAQAVALRSLFWLGQREAFEARWQRAPGTLREMPLMGLFRAANRVLRTEEREAYSSFGELYLKSSPDSDDALSVARLALHVHGAMGEEVRCRLRLEDLQKRRADVFADYLPYWRVLTRAGKATEALQSYAEAPAPVTQIEAAALVQMLHQQGRTDEALQVSTRELNRLGNPAALWLDHGNILMKTKRWGELKNIANATQQSQSLFPLWSTARYWEGVAELFLGDVENAESCFAQIAEYPLFSPESGLELAHHLRQLKQMDAAESVLLKLDEVFNDERDYWIARSQLAATDKDLAIFSRSARRAYELDSESHDSMNLMVASLLWERKEAPRALELCQELVSRDAAAIGYRLNLIHALIQNDRLSEAEAQLSTLEGVKVPTAELVADYRFALFELAYAQERFDDLSDIGKGIDRRFFMPEKVAWIESAVAKAKSAI